MRLEQATWAVRAERTLECPDNGWRLLFAEHGHDQRPGTDDGRDGQCDSRGRDVREGREQPLVHLLLAGREIQAYLAGLLRVSEARNTRLVERDVPVDSDAHAGDVNLVGGDQSGVPLGFCFALTISADAGEARQSSCGQPVRQPLAESLRCRCSDADVLVQM